MISAESSETIIILESSMISLDASYSKIQFSGKVTNSAGNFYTIYGAIYEYTPPTAAEQDAGFTTSINNADADNESTGSYLAKMDKLAKTAKSENSTDKGSQTLSKLKEADPSTDDFTYNQL